MEVAAAVVVAVVAVGNKLGQSSPEYTGCRCSGHRCVGRSRPRRPRVVKMCWVVVQKVSRVSVVMVELVGRLMVQGVLGASVVMVLVEPEERAAAPMAEAVAAVEGKSGLLNLEYMDCRRQSGEARQGSLLIVKRC